VLGLTARRGDWRLRSGLTATDNEGWRIDGGNINAARNLGQGAIALDLDWNAQSGRLGAGVTFSQQIGSLGLSAGMGREEQGWRFGVGLTMGLWRGPQGLRTAPSGIARSGAIMAELFVDENDDGARGADEVGVKNGRFIVGAALRREATDEAGMVLIRGIAPGPDVDLETQLSSLEDFTLRPLRAGDRLVLRPGEVRHVAVPLRPTGSIEVQVLLSAGDRRTPRSGVPVILRDDQGHEVARAITDFDGFVLFDALAFGAWQAEAAGQESSVIILSRDKPEQGLQLLLPPL
jgi:hypothetical protein